MDQNEAKNLFLYYNGSRFHMLREGNGDYQKYKAFNVSKNQEKEWLKERILELLKLEMNFSEWDTFSSILDLSTELRDEVIFSMIFEKILFEIDGYEFRFQTILITIIINILEKSNWIKLNDRLKYSKKLVEKLWEIKNQNIQENQSNTIEISNEVDTLISRIRKLYREIK
ncbi:MAG: hypothetical protein WBP76_04510 [Leptotrichiaceae bacterium]|jgi:hypothetical protein|nr:hypothetical protein [Leptotrichiaceae bacterium]MBP7025758.1 hypothetical protein [Leptotrichiaceae bacterium]MBP9539090.1 hypothetical protein [Leptotrichiaceae bacterium]